MSGRRILVIDDDAVDRKAIGRTLAQAGWDGDVLLAATADEARRAVSETRFDCILLDYHLPGTDGLELLTELRGVLGPWVPLIMLTGEGSEMVAVQAMKRGAYDYLPKAALAPDTLLRAVTQALDKSGLERELAEARALIEHQALHDNLTKLGNRRLFMRDLDRAIAAAQRNGVPFCVLMMDLDKFKAVNDTHGHEAGDAVLIEVGRRLAVTGRANDAFYRLGGDEFTALIDGVGGEAIPPIVERLRAAVAVPVPWQGSSLGVGVSVGVAAYPRDGATRDELLRVADAAMYEAKRAGRTETA